MADEYGRTPYDRKIGILEELGWASLKEKRGAELEVHYVTALRELGNKPGMLGQYFTPCPQIRAVVECIRPLPDKTIADPACGTGGFFLAAYDFLVVTYPCMDKTQQAFLTHDTFFGNQIDGESCVSPNDAFVATTSNKALNFVQHIRSMLKTTGQADVVAPDNVLFEGGAGETVRRKLLETTDLHTILRLPTGSFYANGVKANVLFFDSHPARKEAWTREVWAYDYRTNIHHTLKKKPLRYEDLQDFVACYNPLNRFERRETWAAESNPEGRWRKFGLDQIVDRDKTSLDIFWLKDKSLADLDNLPEPDDLAGEIIENLEAGLNSFRAVSAALQ